MHTVDPDLLAATTVLHYFQKRLHVHVYQLNEEGGEDDDEGEDGVVSYREWQLPAADFEGSWDALYYESAIKRRLLQYASSALLFSDLGVDSQLISWNRCWGGGAAGGLVWLGNRGWEAGQGTLRLHGAAEGGGGYYGKASCLATRQDT